MVFKLQKKELIYFCTVFLLAIVLITISSMAVREANTTTSTNYKTSVRGFGGIALASALAIIIAAPILIIKKQKKYF